MTTIPITTVTVDDLRAEKGWLEERAGMAFEDLLEAGNQGTLSREQVDILFQLESVVEMLRIEASVHT